MSEWEIIQALFVIFLFLLTLYLYIDGYRPAKHLLGVVGEIVEDPESRKSMMASFASEILAVVNFSLMGQASGDSKHLTKAKGVIMDALVNDVAPTVIGGQWGPVISLLMKSAGVKDYLADDDGNMEHMLKAAGALMSNFDLSQLGLGNEPLDRPRGEPGASMW